MERTPFFVTLFFALILSNGIAWSQAQENNQHMSDDTIGRVTGIGGFFFKSKDVEATKQWYYKQLGLVPNDYGSLFEFKEAETGDPACWQWSPFAESTKYFDPSESEFMINFRVKNIEALVDQLKAEGVTITDSIAEYDYGKFVHIMDPEGRKIELWEPVDEVFPEMNADGKTTK